MNIISSQKSAAPSRPNVIYVFADQWRAQAMGYAGDPNVITPRLDDFARSAVDVTQAIAGIPVCGPSRACLMTGQHPLTHGVFVNDVPLSPDAESIGKVFRKSGYATAYVGKWHLDGHGRSAYIPPERRHGFDYWKVLECTHDYNHSRYYDNNQPVIKHWDGYDVFAQTDDACAYIRQHAGGLSPFFLMLSWGPPHNPYQAAPERFRRLYDPDKLELRPNVPRQAEQSAREELAGYYAHCSAMDEAFGRILETIAAAGITENTIVVFTSDHGDMLRSHGETRKQRPWDESVRVPFLLRYPARFGAQGRKIPAHLDTPDIMPTLLSLCGLEIPTQVEGRDFSRILDESAKDSLDAGFIQCVHPFGEYSRENGGREYRGLRTRSHTYVETLDGPWLLYDNLGDPYQLKNLVNAKEHESLVVRLASQLRTLLKARGDSFETGLSYIEKWGYRIDETGTVPYD